MGWLACQMSNSKREMDCFEHGTVKLDSCTVSVTRTISTCVSARSSFDDLSAIVAVHFVAVARLSEENQKSPNFCPCSADLYWSLRKISDVHFWLLTEWSNKPQILLQPKLNS